VAGGKRITVIEIETLIAFHSEQIIII